MKNRKLIAALIIIMIVVSGSLVSCASEEDGPRDVAQRFFDAVKVGDTNGAIECFTPAFQQQYNSIVSLGGMFGKEYTGYDVSSLFGGFTSMANQDAYQDCVFTADDVTFTDDSHEHATVHVTVEGATDGIPSSTTVDTVLYDGKWYIDQ